MLAMVNFLLAQKSNEARRRKVEFGPQDGPPGTNVNSEKQSCAYKS